MFALGQLLHLYESLSSSEESISHKISSSELLTAMELLLQMTVSNSEHCVDSNANELPRLLENTVQRLSESVDSIRFSRSSALLNLTHASAWPRFVDVPSDLYMDVRLDHVLRVSTAVFFHKAVSQLNVKETTWEDLIELSVCSHMEAEWFACKCWNFTLQYITAFPESDYTAVSSFFSSTAKLYSLLQKKALIPTQQVEPLIPPILWVITADAQHPSLVITNHAQPCIDKEGSFLEESHDHRISRKLVAAGEQMDCKPEVVFKPSVCCTDQN